LENTIISEVVLNQETGELETKDFRQVRTKKKIKGGYSNMYYKKFASVLELLRSQKEIMTFNYITSKFTFKQTEVLLTYSQHKGKVQLDRSMYHALIKRLVDAEYLMKVGGERSGLYRLNPFVYLPLRADAEVLQKEWNELKEKKDV